MKRPKEVVDPRLRDKTVALFRAIAHHDRLLVLLALSRRGRLCVSDLTEICGATQSGMSHQLRALREAGLVRTERVGKQIFYQLDDKHVAHIIEDAVAHVEESGKSRK